MQEQGIIEVFTIHTQTTKQKPKLNTILPIFIHPTLEPIHKQENILHVSN